MATLESIEAGNKTLVSTHIKSNTVKSHATSCQNAEKDEVKVKCCSLCSENHGLPQCNTFRTKTPHDRKDFAQSKKLCFLCLGPHLFRNYRKRTTCSTCRGRHHTLIHIESVGKSSKTESQYESSSPPNNLTGTTNNDTRSLASESPSNKFTHATKLDSFSANLTSNFVLLSTAWVRVTIDGHSYYFKALIDQCSQASFVTEYFCQKLTLHRTASKVEVSGLADLKPTLSRGYINFNIHPWFESSYSCEVEALVLTRVSGYRPAPVMKNSEWTHLDNLNLADPYYLKDFSVDMLLGTEVHAKLVLGEIIKGNLEQPIATKTHLEWMISGPTSSHQANSSSFIHCVDNTILLDLIERFWKQEELPSNQKLLTAEEQYCEQYFLQTYTMIDEGRYMVRLPFNLEKLKLHSKDLGSSYDKAVKTLLSMERKFDKLPDFPTKYRAFMFDYEYLSHMELATPLNKEQRQHCFYLPHHGVLQGQKKLRTVFNGSATVGGVSLNDLLLPGPNLIPELFVILLKWRRYPYVFVTDIIKMFRQILVHPLDRKWQMILWRSQSHEIATYKLKTVTYGLTCSPYLAIRTLMQLADDYSHLFELAASVIKEESYVDDFISGAYSVSEGLEKQRQLAELLKVGGFALGKWAANNPELIDWVPPEQRVEESPVFETIESTSILGLSWSPVKDCFHFIISLQSSTPKEPTKRSILSTIAKLFDPLGWLAPVTIAAKIFMQSLWLLKCDWDDALPADYVKYWSDFYLKITALSEIKIPRWIGYKSNDQHIEFHGFADASSKAYGAVLYLRIIRKDQILVSLQCAKTRVAPTKILSIPRLELCAAHLLAKLSEHFLKVMPIENPAIHLWTDSRDVLYWIRAHPSRWQTFVAKRCSEIQTLLLQAFWHHVRSQDNPADSISRGIDPCLLKDYNLWWKGPDFLRGNTNPWTTEAAQIELVPAEERKLIHSVNVKIDDHNETLERFASLNRLIRVTSWCIRFITKLNSRLQPITRDKILLLQHKFFDLDFEACAILCSQELKNVESLWIYIVQTFHFSRESKCIKAGKALSDSKLTKLHAFLDRDLLHVGGRLRFSEFDFEEKYPLILPSNNHLVTLLVRDSHARSLHGGTQLTLYTLRNKYWVIKGMQSVKSIINTCIICLRHSTRTYPPIMSDLPHDRVSPAHPFQHSGVDFAGPFKVRPSKFRGKGTQKSYISRAIHLELVKDYTSDAFIAAFKRFTARRGHCNLLSSDCGTNFVGADAELRRLYQAHSTEFQDVTNQLVNGGTTWRFNPLSAPHFGGIWEAALKSTKYHIRRVIDEHILTFIELVTVLCQIEACLNSWPLCPLSDDPNDFDVLSPAHFLIHRPSFIIPEPSLLKEKCAVGKRWQLTAQMVQRFWASWSKGYLRSLQERHKWTRPHRAFQVGDIVLIKDSLQPPACWPLARITSVHPGADNQIRVVELKTTKTSIVRPVVKWCYSFLVQPSLKNREEK